MSLLDVNTLSVVDINKAISNTGSYLGTTWKAVAVVVGAVLFIWGIVQLIKVFTDKQGRMGHIAWSIVAFGVGFILISNSGLLSSFGDSVNQTTENVTGVGN